jgi:hypothetical protein
MAAKDQKRNEESKGSLRFVYHKINNNNNVTSGTKFCTYTRLIHSFRSERCNHVYYSINPQKADCFSGFLNFVAHSCFPRKSVIP